MKRTSVIVFTFVAFFLLPFTQAQEQKTGENQTREEQSVFEPSTAAEDVQDDGSEEADDETQESDENFIPTEKINVDSSVSFPVDI